MRYNTNVVMAHKRFLVLKSVELFPNAGFEFLEIYRLDLMTM